ncbi:MAG: heme ABC exporter ATP-binding protein CcmA [Thermoprotei archaeon]
MSESIKPRIRVVGVYAGYFGRAVIKDVSFNIDEVGVHVVLGPNGAGKTTLLRSLAGILKPLKGEIEVCGYPAYSSSARQRVGYLTHLDGIPEGMRVMEALKFYAKIEGATTRDLEEIVSKLDLTELVGRHFSQLSQGQKKRVAVARVFLKKKDVYLLDEPTSNLDPKISSEIRSMILGLSANSLVLYSTHNLFEAREIGRLVVALKDGSLRFFGNIDELRVEKYTVGVRTLDGSQPPGSTAKMGEYYLYELSGPEGVPELVSSLMAKGVIIREVREMSNPLEELFK